MPAKIEDAIRDVLLDMSAVSALTTKIRPDEARQSDLNNGASAIIISVSNEEFDNTLDGRCDLAVATVNIVAVCVNKSDARDLAEAIRLNGTNPGTGMAGLNATTASVPFRSMLTNRSIGFERFADGSEDGFYFVDSSYTIQFYETA